MVDLLVVALAVLVCAVGLGLGATLNVPDILVAFKHKQPFAIAMSAQFFFMPAAAYGLARAFDLDSRIAVGMVLVGCAPGGSFSNFYCYLSGGDVALSISLSAISTLAALAFMPMNVEIYINTTFTEDGKTRIPFVNIVVTLLLILVPSAFGIYIRTKSLVWAKRLELLGSVVGVVFLVAAFAWGIAANHSLFNQTGEVWFCAVSLQLIGTAFGYFAATVLRQPMWHRRTIALETGVQNSALVIAAVGISFDDEDVRDDVLVYPLIFSFATIFNSVGTVAFFRYYLVPRDVEYQAYCTAHSQVADDAESSSTHTSASTEMLKC